MFIYLIAAVTSFLHTHRLRIDRHIAHECTLSKNGHETKSKYIVQKGTEVQMLSSPTQTGASIAIFLLTPAEIINYRCLHPDPPPLTVPQCMCSEVDVKEIIAEDITDPPTLRLPS